MEYFFFLFFNLQSMSVLTYEVSCKQHAVNSCFLIHFANLYILIEEFRPFIFSVIMDTCLWFAVTLILLYLILSWFSFRWLVIYWSSFIWEFGDFFFGSSMCNSSLSILCRAGLVYPCHGRLLIPQGLWKRVLLGTVILVGNCFLLELEISHSMPSLILGLS